MPKTIGFIGLGLMGKPMAKNLLKAGHRLIVHNRSRAAVDELAAEGAAAAFSPKEVAASAEVVITMLPEDSDVETVVAGDQGVIKSIRPNGVLVDMSTISPTTARRLAEILQSDLRRKR